MFFTRASFSGATRFGLWSTAYRKPRHRRQSRLAQCVAAPRRLPSLKRATLASFRFACIGSIFHTCQIRNAVVPNDEIEIMRNPSCVAVSGYSVVKQHTRLLYLRSRQFHVDGSGLGTAMTGIGIHSEGSQSRAHS